MVKKIVSAAASLALLVLIISAALPALASGNTPAIEPPPPRPLYEPGGIIRSMDPSLETSAQTEETPALLTKTLSAQSAVVYNHLDGQTLNIYLFDTFTGATSMLTYGGYNNIGPRINPGFDRIAFFSAHNSAYHIYTMNMDGSNITRVGNFSSDAVNPAWSPDGSHLAFASTMDNSSGEIYTMDTNGGGLQRLTNNNYYDDLPSWSPDGSKIAYTSYANNVYRVWVMNADGSGAMQLSQEAYSETPVWSADGSQIAYDADGDGDGWQEVWVMNADGTGRHQVYKPGSANSDAYMGSWNPGGTGILFNQVEWIYYGGNWYWTSATVMSLNVVEGAPGIYPMGDVNWYPDWGSTDHLAPVTQMNDLPEEVPYKFHVSWSGQDQGEAGLYLYNVQYKEGINGTWKNWLPYTDKTWEDFTGKGGITYYFRTRAFDRVGNLTRWIDTNEVFTRVESMPPESSVRDTPRYARESVTVRWGGIDPGRSGIRDYDIQYMDASAGNWVAWLTKTTDTSHVFTGTVGHTYYFRSQATDNAGNVEAWPEGDGDAQVTFYDWLVDGLATDILGAPIIGVKASITNNEVGNIPSDYDGKYTAYGVAGEDELVSWSKEGYSSLPETTLDGTADRRFDIYLPPDPNAILNPSFETGLDDWQISGTVTSDALAHTGQLSALLGSPVSFGDSLQLEDYTSWTTIGGLAADDLGGLHALWKKDNLVFYRYRNPQGIWSDSELVDASFSPNDYPIASLAITPQGIPHVFWTSDQSMYHSYRLGPGSWSTPQDLSGSYYSPGRPLGMADEASGVHLVWKCHVNGIGEVCYRYRTPDGNWEDIEQLTANSQDSITGPVKITVKAGEVHLLYYKDSEYYYVKRNTSGAWSTAEQPCPGCMDNSGMTMAVDESGNPQASWYVQWNDGNDWHYDLYFSQRSPLGSWSTPVLIFENASYPQMVIDLEGRTHIAWVGGTTNGIFHGYRELDSTWHRSNSIYSGWVNSYDLIADKNGAIHLVFPNGYTHWMGGPQWAPVVNYNGSDQQVNLAAAVDSFGGINVLWSDAEVSSSNLVYVGSHVVADKAVSTLTQQVQVDGSLANPKLSFFTASGGADLSSGSNFTITLSTSDTISLVYSSSGWSNGWQHHTLDMTPWAGQAVTLTYTLVQPAGYPDAWANIDEAALGEVYTDPWVDLQGGAERALAGYQISYQVIYGNRGMVDANSTGLVMTLPTSFSLVEASVEPEVVGNQLVWDLGSLPANSAPITIDITVQVNADAPMGSTVTSTLVIATASPELETSNNSAESRTFLGAFFYIPVLLR